MNVGINPDQLYNGPVIFVEGNLTCAVFIIAPKEYNMNFISKKKKSHSNHARTRHVFTITTDTE